MDGKNGSDHYNSRLWPLTVTDTVDSFFKPANDAVWLKYLSTHGGLGYSAATSVSDAQSAL